MNDECRKQTNPEYTEKIISMMKLFLGKNVGDDFPFESVTRWLDGRLIAIERGKIEIEYTVRQEMTNPSGFLHGGIQATMLDDAIGMISATLGYDVAVLSIDMHLDYLGPGRKGDTLTARAEIEREGSSVIHASAFLEKSDGSLVAKARSNLLISNQPADYIAFMKG